MTGIAWITGAERLAVSAPGGTITSTAPPRVVWHTTEAPSGQASMWQAMQKVLTSKGAEPQVLYDPSTDRLGQFMPLDVSARALRNDGASRTNRTGRVCIQIEVIAFANKPFTAYWKPGSNFRNLLAALRSWGIPEVWPSGPPPQYIDGRGNVPEDERSRTIWLSRAGHYGHSHVPGNSHGDPGGIDVAALFAAGKDLPPPIPPTEADMPLTDADVQKILDTPLSTGGTTVRGALAKALWLAEQFGQTGQFENQLDRIEAKP